MKIYEGKLVAQGMRVGIVASRFNEFIVSKPVSYTHLPRRTATSGSPSATTAAVSRRSTCPT